MVNEECNGHMILYRGSLKSCNYYCSYCPFSKRKISQKELEKDKEQWDAFVMSLTEKGGALGVRALMVVPYGEAMIHPWYWGGLGHISALPFVDGVGAQTNLSFGVQKSVEDFEKAGGRIEKLRLWATFHPEMTKPGEFAQKCKRLKSLGVSVSAGAVGVPQNMEILRLLRRELPEDTYLWINKMDGLGRPYTQEEKEEFLRIDPYFLRELVPVPADVSQCRGRLFVEGNGRLRTCNIGPLLEEGWEDICRKAEMGNDRLLPGLPGTEWKKGEKENFPLPKCGRKRCSCYLAYGGRGNDWNRMLFGPYSLYRIPRRPKAVFLDIEGTLLFHQTVPTEVMAGLEGLHRDRIPLFFATTLPLKDARKRCRKIWHLFSGGIFAGGAHLLMKKAGADGMGEEKGKEEDGEWGEVFYFLEEALLGKLEALKRKYFFRILAIRKNDKIYKITLLRPYHKDWEESEPEELFGTIWEKAGQGVRYFMEGNCLQIVAKEATKANGIRTLCQWMNIEPEDTYAVGDSKEDEEMMRVCNGKKEYMHLVAQLRAPAESNETPNID